MNSTQNLKNSNENNGSMSPVLNMINNNNNHNNDMIITADINNSININKISQLDPHSSDTTNNNENILETYNSHHRSNIRYNNCDELANPSHNL